MKHIIPILGVGLLTILFACFNGNSGDEAIDIANAPGDLKDILKKGKLTVLLENSSTSYFIYRGKAMGFEYELLKEFADDLGVKLEVKILRDLDELTTMLNSREGDIIGCNLTFSKEREKKIDFSQPFVLTPQVLIQRKPKNWEELPYEELGSAMIRKPEELANKKIHVWKNSSNYRRLIHLQEEIGETIHIVEQDGNIGTEELIEMVADGMIDYTVTEQNIAKANVKFYSNLDISTELSVRQKICFGLRKNCPLLKARLDRWLNVFMNSAEFRYLSRRYFETSPSLTSDSYRFEPGKNEISPFDAIFKKEAGKYKWDWTILAAIAYQESRFNPHALGHGGSYSMMQFMPSTGPKYGVFPDSPPEVQIAGGMKLLHTLYKKFSFIPDEQQRIKFCLASYNAGHGHVEDAMRLAQKYGKDPNRWDDNTEVMMVNLSKHNYFTDPVVKNGSHRGGVTFKYVRSIFARHLEWSSFYRSL